MDLAGTTSGCCGSSVGSYSLKLLERTEAQESGHTRPMERVGNEERRREEGGEAKRSSWSIRGCRCAWLLRAAYFWSPREYQSENHDLALALTGAPSLTHSLPRVRSAQERERSYSLIIGQTPVTHDALRMRRPVIGGRGFPGGLLRSSGGKTDESAARCAGAEHVGRDGWPRWSRGGGHECARSRAGGHTPAGISGHT